MYLLNDHGYETRPQVSINQREYGTCFYIAVGCWSLLQLSSGEGRLHIWVFLYFFLVLFFLTLSTLCVFFSYLLCHFVNSWVMKAKGNISTRKNQRKMRERWSPKRGKHAITKHIINFLMLQQVTSKVPILRSECCNICFLENRANERGE